jgi:hypothetical protein
MGLDTEIYWLTDWLTDRQSQCDFDYHFDFSTTVAAEKSASLIRASMKLECSELFKSE